MAEAVMLRAKFMPAKINIATDTPARLGYVMPAEWEPHTATWLGWPHNASDWPGKFEVIPWIYGEMIRKISAGESIRLLVRHQQDKQFAHHILQARRGGFAENQIRHPSHESRLDARHRADFREARK